jgi:non-ribosomal peptide synthetase component F
VNIAASLLRSADARADRVAVRLDGSELTYRELNEASARVAALVQEHGLRPGDRVGIMLPNVIQFAVAYYGPWLARESLDMPSHDVRSAVLSVRSTPRTRSAQARAPMRSRVACAERNGDTASAARPCRHSQVP